MKNKILLTLAFVFFLCIGVRAQSPDLINYQAVARDLSGNPLVSTAVAVTYDIRQTSSTGTIVYSETHNLTTNQFGLFTAKIGGGTPVTGTFSGINWSTGLYYLQVTVNGDVMAATQLLSVPYALHANTATSGTPGANGHANLADSVAEPAGVNCANGGYLIHMGADDNDNGTLETLEIDISYYICNGLDGSANNNDTSATNEIQTLSLSNDTIFLSKGGMFVKLPPALGDDWGSQVVVTSGTNISGDGTTGNPLMVTDSVDDADNDPNNERITTFALNSTNDSLIIVEAGVRHAFPLSNLNDGDWTKGTGSDIFNNSDSVGVGTNNPKSLFQIGDNMHLFPFSLPAPEEYAVVSYNSHHDGSAIRNTTGGVSGFSFIGHKTGQPNYGVHLFAAQPAGTDMTLLNPDLKINLSNKGFGVYVDNPRAGIDVKPIDSAGVMIRVADNGSTSNLFFEDTQNLAVGIKAPTVLTNNYGLTLPVNLPTASGSSLVSDLVGNLSWAAPQGGSLWNNAAPNINYTAGNVGIGTSTPSRILDIQTSTSSVSEALRVINTTSTNSESHGIRAEASGAPNTNEGIWSQATGGNYSKGLYARGSAGNFESVGVEVDAYGSTNNYGLKADLQFATTGSSRAVYGNARGSGSTNNYGVYGIGREAVNNYGVYGSAYNGTNNWAGYFDDGDVYIKNNLCIGISSPSEKLDVNGSTKVTGEYKYASAKVKTLSIPINALNFKRNPSSSSTANLIFDSYVVGYYGESAYCSFYNGNTNIDAVATAPVYLPHGARLISLTAKWFDQSSTVDASISLERVGYSTINNSQLAIVSTSGSTTTKGGMFAGVTNTFSSVFIDNDNNSYYIKFTSKEATPLVGFGKIVITYSVEQAD